MSRVTQAHIDARVEAITGAANVVFSRKGFAGATMAEIAAEAGVSAGAIYRYFRSKEEIIEAMSVESCERREAIVREIAAQGDTITVLDQLANTFFSQLAEPDTQAGCIELELASEATRNPQIKEVVQRGFDGLIASFAAIIRRGQAQGDINPRLDAESVARVMMGAFDGLATQQAAGHDVDVWKYVEVFKAMMGGTFWTGSVPTRSRKGDHE